MSLSFLNNHSTIHADLEMYNDGLTKYEEIKRQLDNLIENFDNATKNAHEIETQNASFLYDGTYASTIGNIKTSLENIKLKLEDSFKIAKRQKEIAELLDKEAIPNGLAVFALKRLGKSYIQKYQKKFKLGATPDENVNYINIYNEKYTPQGLIVIGNQVFITAYSKDKKNSKIYVYDTNNPNKNYSVVLDNNSHLGGITYDEENHVLLITGAKGSVNAYSLDAINNASRNVKKDAVLDIKDNPNIKLNSNINMNYNIMDSGKTTTGYNAATVYYDNKDKKMYIAQFSNDGKMVTGDVKYDKATGTYSLENATTSNIDSSIQGISTYHKDNKTYLIESRSYGSNKSNLTVRDITNGVENSTIVGSKSLGHEYSEAIHVDDKGKALILYEGGKFGQYDNTEMVDINNLISKGNGKVAKMSVDTSYDKGYESKDGYNTLT